MGGRWRCPRCEREFSRANQAHTCVPGVSVEAYFAGRPALQREIFEALLGHLRGLGPVHVDAVGVGVFLRRVDKIAELRPRRSGFALYLILPGMIDTPRCVRSIRISALRTAYVIMLMDATDVDAELREWLTQAYAYGSG